MGGKEAARHVGLVHVRALDGWAGRALGEGPWAPLGQVRANHHPIPMAQGMGPFLSLFLSHLLLLGNLLDGYLEVSELRGAQRDQDPEAQRREPPLRPEVSAPGHLPS